MEFNQKDCPLLLKENDASLLSLMSIIVDAGGEYYRWIFDNIKILPKDFLCQILSSDKSIFNMSLVVKDENKRVLGCIFYIYGCEFKSRSRTFFYLILSAINKELTKNFLEINKIFYLNDLGQDLGKNDIYISHIGVIDFMRRSGLAGSMIQFLLDRYDRIYLHVDSSNQAAINCYMKMGFYELSKKNNTKMKLFSTRRKNSNE
jgi:hypothetical protein